MKYGLSDAAVKKIHNVFARYPEVEKAILYGSRAKGDYKNGSDIDMTLSGGDDITVSVLGKIMEDIDDLLLPYTVDLSIFSRISDQEVINHIRRVGVIFYEKTEESTALLKEKGNG
ncbi:nucleotidyltransferase domain protein [bacterium BMS3Bbin09]|nr:nucleotidyltransferase domain protein [bacterium BMS3Bbin09]HDN94631.1 nucleotidyltransferase domain-containing protein [Nitrospirota bacterium]